LGTFNLNNFTFRGCCCPFEYELSQQEKGKRKETGKIAFSRSRIKIDQREEHIEKHLYCEL
jgi:hypothetical protein